MTKEEFEDLKFLEQYVNIVNIVKENDNLKKSMEQYSKEEGYIFALMHQSIIFMLSQSLYSYEDNNFYINILFLNNKSDVLIKLKEETNF
jgi:hypothetical protein